MRKALNGIGMAAPKRLTRQYVHTTHTLSRFFPLFNVHCTTLDSKLLPFSCFHFQRAVICKRLVSHYWPQGNREAQTQTFFRVQHKAKFHTKKTRSSRVYDAYLASIFSNGFSSTANWIWAISCFPQHFFPSCFFIFEFLGPVKRRNRNSNYANNGHKLIHTHSRRMQYLKYFKPKKKETRKVAFRQCQRAGECTTKIWPREMEIVILLRPERTSARARIKSVDF